jgi:DNA invertase Pin-like site-specific DNA recombinase
LKTKKRVGVYVRVSTQDQSTKAQENELKEFARNRGWEVTHVYSDTISGTTKSRPGLDQLMADCRKRRVDAVLVWKFDRFARSLRHLVTALEEFKALGIHFISATEGIDTTVPSGEMVFQIFGAIAQFERTLICERVKAGLTEAKRKGTRLGRPPIKKLTDIDVAKIRAARKKGITLRTLSKQFGASLWAVYQAAQR